MKTLAALIVGLVFSVPLVLQPALADGADAFPACNSPQTLALAKRYIGRMSDPKGKPLSLLGLSDIVEHSSAAEGRRCIATLHLSDGDERMWLVLSRSQPEFAKIWGDPPGIDIHADALPDTILATGASPLRDLTAAEHAGIDPLLDRWADENDLCRGGSGDADTTLQACDRRSFIDARLGNRGMCYGREGESGYQESWHRCETRSLAYIEAVDARRLTAP